MKCLIVDDDPTGLALLERYLKPFGQITTAVNGVQAVAVFREAAQRGEPFQFVCLDIVMPEMNGQQALREMRAIETSLGLKEGVAARIVMTTSLDDKESLLEAISMCDAYLVKPIHMSDLMFYLQRFGLAR
jgi:two-component system, chemotaxis family, chemotaxis protein CheY